LTDFEQKSPVAKVSGRPRNQPIVIGLIKSDLRSFHVGRIEYVKFTSVIFDFDIYFIYLNKTATKKITKQPDINIHRTNKQKVIRSPMPVLQVKNFIFLNFVFKIQKQYYIDTILFIYIQYFLRANANNTRSC